MSAAPTPRDTLLREGTARLYRFRAASGAPRANAAAPLLLVPSLINRWYVLDLREGASMAGALVSAGVDAFCLDWGVPEDEDRYLDWEAVLARLARAVRVVKRTTGAKKVSLLGYCMGGTLASIHAALHPDEIAALVDLAGPIDFSHGGMLRTLVDERWFDPGAVAAAGNVTPSQMQNGFAALRPTLAFSKWVGLVDRGFDPKAREAFDALEAWSSDNVPFPGAAYETYIADLYQGNKLVKGEHRAFGRRVDLAAITCPVLAIVAEKDAICPPAAATALLRAVSSRDATEMKVPGGHVGAVVGSRASRELYPALARWLEERTGRPAAEASFAPAN
jgi:polyhydroxyalkanoate synthase